MRRVKVSVHSIIQLGSESGSSSNAIILKEEGGERCLLINIDSLAIEVIKITIIGVELPRPIIHDLLKSVIEKLGDKLTEVNITKITKLKDRTFYATLNFRSSAEVDARPSDAIVLALKCNAPIFVAEEVMEKASFIPGKDKTYGKKTKAEQAAGGGITKKEGLEAELAKAVAKEEYEKAAEIRDEIKKLL